MTQSAGADTTHEAQVVTLTIPADHRYAMLARVAVASLASDLDPAVEDLDDLRMAIQELVGLLVEASGGLGDVEVSMHLDGSSVVVGGRCSGVAAPIEPDDLTVRILDATVDAHEVGGGAFSMRKTLAGVTGG